LLSAWNWRDGAGWMYAAPPLLSFAATIAKMIVPYATNWTLMKQSLSGKKMKQV
jgi:hypothetical protein